MVTTDFETPTGLARHRFLFLHESTANTLIRAGLRSWPQVATATDKELLALKGIGPSTLDSIRAEQRAQVR